MALKIENAEHFDAVKAFAEANGCAAALQETIDYLEGYGNRDSREKGEPDAVVCHLHKDFAPQSFAFVWMKNGKFWMNGGAIFYGASDPRWGVHT